MTHLNFPYKFLFPNVAAHQSQITPEEMMEKAEEKCQCFSAFMHRVLK